MTTKEVTKEVNQALNNIKENVFKTTAQMMLEELERTKPDKTKTLEEQCNEEQLKTVNYLKKVIETGQP